MSVNIYNTTKKTIVNLSIIDPCTGYDWAADCISNTARGFASSARDDAKYEGATEQIEWWADYFSAQQAADYRWFEARKMCTSDQLAALNDLLADVDGDIESHPVKIHDAIDRVMGVGFGA